MIVFEIFFLNKKKQILKINQKTSIQNERHNFVN